MTTKSVKPPTVVYLVSPPQDNKVIASLQKHTAGRGAFGAEDEVVPRLPNRPEDRHDAGVPDVRNHPAWRWQVLEGEAAGQYLNAHPPPDLTSNGAFE